MTEGVTTDSYPVSPRNRVKRLHERGRYDHAPCTTCSMPRCCAMFLCGRRPALLHADVFLARQADLWHGSSASRMLRNQASGQRVCLTVAHLDSLVLARCGFNHSADYRAVMAFGNAYLVTDPDEKAQALVAMVDRFFPDRTAGLRQSTAQEIKASSVIAMEIEEASAKIRSKGVGDDEEDYALPIYAEKIPVRTVRCAKFAAAAGGRRATGVAQWIFGRPSAGRRPARSLSSALPRRLRSG